MTKKFANKNIVLLRHVLTFTLFRKYLKEKRILAILISSFCGIISGGVQTLSHCHIVSTKGRLEIFVTTQNAYLALVASQ